MKNQLLALLLFGCSVFTVQAQNPTIPYGDNPEVGKYAEVNGIKVYYEIYGEGEPLLLIHGNGGSIKSSTPKIDYYKDKYKVIAMDSRAHGKTKDIGDSLTYEQMTADVNDVLDQLNIDSCLIWGQSDGGIIGLKLAIDYPDKVKRLAVFGANLRPDSTAVDDDNATFVKNMIANETDDYKLRLFGLLVNQPQIPVSDLAKITAPVLVMTGDRDVIRLEHSLEVFYNIKKSNLFVMPGATHFGSYEKPELFFKVLDNFFTQPFTTTSTYDIIKNIKF
ncbi:alpha/beta fold hydrolase [Reichenbachiella sp.]|uniref:alpha/beta fold hydrolase n=1 Tax=Reichenbachiella sp. TaxID=2184521 RepID=UPI003BAE7586